MERVRDERRRPPFTQVEDDVMLDATMTPGARVLYVLLVRAAFRFERPSQAEMAATLACSTRTVRRYVAELEDAHVVAVEGDVGDACTYVLLDRQTPIVPADTSVLPPIVPGGQECPGLTANDHCATAGASPALRAVRTEGQGQETIVRDAADDFDAIVVHDAEVLTPGAAAAPALCALLADKIVANGSKRPTIGKRWLDAARLLVDADGRSPEQVARAIEWCQADEFWRANILSMSKLRERYDTLRMQASRAHAGSVGVYAGRDRATEGLARLHRELGTGGTE